MAVGSDRRRQRRLVDARDRGFAGGINVRDNHGIGVIETGGEGVEQRLKPGVAMRLHDRDHLAPVAARAALQDRGDLDRMMAVVVEDGDAVPFPGAGEAPPDAPEGGDRLADDVVDAPARARPRSRRWRSAHCAAGHRQRESSMKVARPVARSRISTRKRVTPPARLTSRRRTSACGFSP